MMCNYLNVHFQGQRVNIQYGELCYVTCVQFHKLQLVEDKIVLL